MARASLLLVVAGVLVVADRAHADPSSLAIDAKDLSIAMTALVEHHDYPIGLVATDDVPAIGLTRGDLVRAINGHTATRASLAEGGAILYLDVMRGQTPLVVRIAVKLEPKEVAIPRTVYRAQVERLEVLGRDIVAGTNHSFMQVMADGKESGAMVRRLWVGFATLLEGDVIRNVDGTEIDTVEHAVQALERAKDQERVTITVDRLGERIVTTLRLDDTQASTDDTDDAAVLAAAPAPPREVLQAAWAMADLFVSDLRSRPR